MTTPQVPGFLVIRGISPTRLRWLSAGAVALLVLLGWGLFALGRSWVGFGATNPFSDAAMLRRAISERDDLIDELRRKAAELDTLKVSQDRERQELAKSIGELQAEVARQRQQLEFYKGIVVTSEPPPNVSIRSLRIDRVGADSLPMMRLSLVQPGNPQSMVSGQIKIVLEGARAGVASREVLIEMPYSFRYFENIERELRVPRGTTPERLTIEVQPAGRADRPVIQSVPWAP